MAKIGVLTFYNNYNYGSYLQSYALINKLNVLGHKTYLIDFNDLTKPWNKRIRIKTVLNRILCLFQNPYLLKELIYSRRVKAHQLSCSNEQKSSFDDFLANNIPIYKGDFTHQEFDTYIVGSDQVWKVTLPGLHYAFFLRFTNKRKRISYAASIGNDSIPSYNKRQLKKYLKGFKSISVREKKTVSLINELDPRLKVKYVLDPVLLIGRDFWQNNIPKSNYEDYILCYFLDPIDNNIGIIHSIISKYPTSKLLVVNTGVNCDSIPGVNIIYPTPLEFVGLLANSSVVVTDSFHGSAFSILFEKEFFIIPRFYSIFPGQKDRIMSLISLFSCNDRYIDKIDQVSKVKDLNLNKIRTTLKNMQTESTHYLEESIKN